LRDKAQRCNLCGVIAQDDRSDSAQRFKRQRLLRSLRSGLWDGKERSALDRITLRQAATLRPLAYHSDEKEPPPGHEDKLAEGSLRLPTPRLAEITLVMLTKELSEDLRARIAVMLKAPAFAEAILLLDRPGSDVGEADGLRILSRPLAGDFGAQRNYAQGAVRTPWVLHLDSDETLSDELLEQLGGAVALADHYGLRALGFPRANRVGGVLSGMFPDTQYRLLRATEAFAGRVHERPMATERWWETMIFLRGHIIHHLSAEHVSKRRWRYDALGQSAERRCEEAELLTPFALRSYGRSPRTLQPCGPK
jgi:hypothetical protein